MSSSVDILPELQALVQKLQDLNTEESDLTADATPASWMMPDKGNWSGSLFDYAGMAGLFDRSRANNLFQTNLTTTGTQGDSVVLQMTVDYMSVLQRAFMARYAMTSPRATAHAMTRRRGHGLQYGTLGLSVIENMSRIVAAGKGPPGQVTTQASGLVVLE